MVNPKTTVAGYCLIGAAVLTAAGHALTGGLTMADVQSLIAGLAGLGLVMAKDGGH